nr:hypothetical protein [Saprospiraceae bacterium]
GTYAVEPGLPAFVWQPCQPVSSVHVTAASDTFSLGNLMMQSVAFTTTTVSGYVYQDLDGDCVQDPGEPTLAGCALWAATEGGFAHPQYFATTDVNGFYSFTLPAGDYYYVRLYSVQGNSVCQPCNNNFFQPLDASPVVHNFGVQCQISTPQHLTGFVFFDENKNCAHDFGEQGLSNWTMHIVKQGATDTLIVDGKFFPDGHFAVPVDTGMYYLQIFPPNYLFLPCQFVQTATVVPGGAPPVFFPVMPLADCPNMTVDVGTNALVPCFTSTYHVQYCNTGTAGADSVYVEISLPPTLTLTQSEIPWSQQSGSTYTFPVGAVPAGDCGTFWFKALLDCNSPIGLTHCVEAHVYPDSICGPQNPMWDGSSVSLSAECVGDSVVLSISNIGWGNMSQPLGFIVVEDNVLIRDSSFQLPSGGSTLITVYPNGATILLQAQQSPGYPGSSMPVVFVEGCGDDSLSIGFVTQYPQNDADDFITIDCRESTGSFDPNIKEAQPKGITDAHFIRPSTELTYQITFQNLGTDTAHNVVILDTLSQFLDTTSLRPGVSSHPYTWKLLGGNVLRFSFDNIGLPHAAANTAGSIGFVKYRISQTPGNTPGTQIDNQAGIYFDFNAPVMTNTVTHRIPAPFMYDYEATGVCYGEPYFADTILVKTLRYAFFDSIITSDITVYPLQSSETDISVAPGTEVCGQPVFQDTACVTVLPDMHGCDSTVTIRVHVLTDAPENPGEGVFLSIGPNPNRGDFTLQGYLPKGGFCRVTLFDHLGREVIKLFDNQWIEGGFNHRVNAGNLPPGAYLLKFDSDEVHLFLKMLVL